MMFKNSRKLILAAIVLLILVSFAGCNFVDGGLTVEDATSRKVSTAPGQVDKTRPDGAPKVFEATVTLYQTYVEPFQQMGNSNRYKVEEETLESSSVIESSGWDLLDGKNVVMSNVTNFNVDPSNGELSGTNHSVIDIIENGETILTLQANGTINGVVGYFAEIDMNWVVKDSYGAKVNALGKVNGTFKWFDIENDQLIELSPPNGTFTLSGTYN